MFDPFCGAGTMMNDLVKVIEAIGGLEPRVAAFAVLALVVVAVLLIATAR